MREIKFRVWDKTFKKMINNEYWLSHPSGQEDFFNIVMYRVSKEQFEVMQYTGLKDKNGNEIYEGDIICCENVYKVCFAYGTFCIDAESEYKVLSMFASESVIVGNVFENNDLL